MHKTVKIEEAVGMVLAHDITEIRRGEFKGTAFKKGHRIEGQDICHLQRLGKQHVYVLEPMEGFLHEDVAAEALASAFCGPGTRWEGPPREGKIKLLAARDGLFKVDVEAMLQVNLLGEIMCASRHENGIVSTNDVVAATRAIPLMVTEDIVDEAVRIASQAGGLFRIAPLRRAGIGVIITGNEVYNRLIEDQFEPILENKIFALGSKILKTTVCPDDAGKISDEIERLLDLGADIILTTGGMSVDPDDVTREAIRLAGGKIDVYGAPVLPGAMFLIASIDGTPVLGIPACGIYHETTILDLVLPRLLAGEMLHREDIAQMGHGGLCLDCPECRFPVCPFGKQG